MLNSPDVPLQHSLMYRCNIPRAAANGTLLHPHTCSAYVMTSSAFHMEIQPRAYALRLPNSMITKGVIATNAMTSAATVTAPLPVASSSGRLALRSSS